MQESRRRQVRAAHLLLLVLSNPYRAARPLNVEATFDRTPPDLKGVPGVSSVHVDGLVVRCQVQGSVEPLLKVLAGQTPTL